MSCDISGPPAYTQEIVSNVQRDLKLANLASERAAAAVAFVAAPCDASAVAAAAAGHKCQVAASAAASSALTWRYWLQQSLPAHDCKPFMIMAQRDQNCSAAKRHYEHRCLCCALQGHARVREFHYVIVHKFVALELATWNATRQGPQRAL